MIFRIPISILATLFIAALSLGSQSPVPSSIKGVVVSSSGGLPVPGVKVTLKPQKGTDRSVDTDGSGAFSIQDLTPGRYSVSLIKAGFVGPHHAMPFQVLLEPGRSVTGLRFNLIPTSVITGRVYGEDERPVEAATVIALRLQYDNSGHRVLQPPPSSPAWFPVDWYPEGLHSDYIVDGAAVTTNDQGEYRLSGLEPGEYYVGVWAKLNPKSLGGIVPVLYYPDVVDPADAVTVMISSERAAGAINFHLKEPSLYTVRFKAPFPPCKTSNLQLFDVVRQSRTGVAVMEGKVISSSTVPSRFEPVAANASFHPSGDDTWVSPGLSPGSYDIDYSPCYASVPFSPESFGHLHVDVVDRDVNAGTMDVRVAAPLTGHVSVAPSAAGLVDFQRLAVQPVDLLHRSPFLSPAGGRYMGLPTLGGIIEDGTFELQRLVPGSYAVQVMGLPPDIYVESVRQGGHDVRDSGFDFDGQPSAPLEITLNNMPGIVNGTVENGRHDAIINASVVLIPDRTRRTNTTLFKTTVTDQTGQFEIRGITPGDYTVMSFEDIEPRAYLNSDFLDRFEGRGTRVRVERGSSNHATIAVIPAQ